MQPGPLLLCLALTTRQSCVLLVIDVWQEERSDHSIVVQYSPCERTLDKRHVAAAALCSVLGCVVSRPSRTGMDILGIAIKSNVQETPSHHPLSEWLHYDSIPQAHPPSCPEHSETGQAETDCLERGLVGVRGRFESVARQRERLYRLW